MIVSSQSEAKLKYLQEAWPENGHQSVPQRYRRSTCLDKGYPGSGLVSHQRAYSPCWSAKAVSGFRAGQPSEYIIEIPRSRNILNNFYSWSGPNNTQIKHSRTLYQGIDPSYSYKTLYQGPNPTLSFKLAKKQCEENCTLGLSIGQSRNFSTLTFVLLYVDIWFSSFFVLLPLSCNACIWFSSYFVLCS